MMLAKTGLIAMVGKASTSRRDRGDPQAQGRYLMAVGGAAYLVSKATGARACRVGDLAWSDLRVRREDMPSPSRRRGGHFGPSDRPA